MTPKGLEGVIAGTSQLSSIIDGILTYRGINIDDLAEQATYEEVVYLLLHGSLPSRAELERFSRHMATVRQLPAGLLLILRSIPRTVVPMDALRTATSALAFFDEQPSDTSRERSLEKAVRLVAQFPTIVAAIARLRRGHEPIDAPLDRTTAEAFLFMLRGEQPTDVEVEAMEKILVLHADHEFNASTFAARVTAATLADMHAAITSAVAALKGPLHGGANAAVMAALQEIGSLERVKPYVRERLARHERIMGFGHRVYKHGDPRAKWLRDMSRRLGEEAGDLRWYEISVKMEEVMQAEKHLFPNVDFYAASVYHYLGIPADLMTLVFATSRIAGWVAHVLEQHADNRLIRPRAEYIGPVSARYVPLRER